MTVMWFKTQIANQEASQDTIAEPSIPDTTRVLSSPVTKFEKTLLAGDWERTDSPCQLKVQPIKLALREKMMKRNCLALNQ